MPTIMLPAMEKLSTHASFFFSESQMKNAMDKADAAGTGRMMQAMMTRGGRYTPSYAAAVTAVSSVIGPIIPPSIPMVLYALVSEASIGFIEPFTSVAAAPQAK